MILQLLNFSVKTLISWIKYFEQIKIGYLIFCHFVFCSILGEEPAAIQSSVTSKMTSETAATWPILILAHFVFEIVIIQLQQM